MIDFSVPIPRALLKPALMAFVAGRSSLFWLKRKFMVEPMFRAYATRCGRGLRTGIFPPWVQGVGELEIGDDVVFHGKVSITFAARYTASPRLTIGDHSRVGHDNTMTVGRAITIGRYCRLASRVMIADSSGHPLDPEARQAGQAAPVEKVQPVTIEDNVWLCTGAIVLPGVTIGEGSVVAAGAVVRQSVPPYSLVAGNPAAVVGTLRRPAALGGGPVGGGPVGGGPVGGGFAMVADGASPLNVFEAR
jgi:acetyltransferase-like isoleucine patch superfamily enzyme